jgi:hypothetical protein
LNVPTTVTAKNNYCEEHRHHKFTTNAATLFLRGVEALHTSGVAAVGDIGRLDGCSSTSGELGTSSSGELEGDMMLFWSKYSGI